MDGQRFDRLARVLASGTSRRTLLRSAVAGIGGAALALLGRDADAAKCRVTGQICRKPGDCCDDFCGPKDRMGRQYCGICPNDGQQCGTGSCCYGEESCVDGACCANLCGEGDAAVCCGEEQTCISTFTQEEGFVYSCCAPELACNDFTVCCPDGETCVGGGCCPEENVCDSETCCTDGETCVDGSCCAEACTVASQLVCCDEGTSCCGDSCVDTEFDSYNCGACGNFCGWYDQAETIPFACCEGDCDLSDSCA